MTMRFLLVLVFGIFSFALHAQESSTNKFKNSSDTIPKRPVHSPKKAAVLSAILPGAGQVYNRKYWKVPVLAAGAGALVYSFQFNQKNYSLFKTELIHRQAGSAEINTELSNLSDANLNELQDFYRRNRDLTVVGMALLYALNILDATVDAHLFDFNVNEDLSLNIRPKTLYSSISSMPIALKKRQLLEVMKLCCV
jgi:hypothetical protein